MSTKKFGARSGLGFALTVATLAVPARAASGPIVSIESGKLKGVAETGATTIRIFRGVPFAAPPVADLRWREPQPVVPWSGIRQATKFAPRCMQQPLFSDMMFRSPAPSEDCLYLNVWTRPSSTGRTINCRYWYISMAAASWPVTVQRRDTTAQR